MLFLPCFHLSIHVSEKELAKKDTQGSFVVLEVVFSQVYADDVINLSQRTLIMQKIVTNFLIL